MAIRLESGHREIGARTQFSEARVLWDAEVIAFPEVRRRPSLHLGTWAVTFAAFLVCVALTLPTVQLPLGYQTMVVMSGSMVPVARPGDVFVIRKISPHQVRVGDVVTFRPLRSDHLTTHRVVGLRYVVGELHFQTKGDANSSVDPDLVPARNVIGRVVYHAPAIGRAYAFAVSTKGRMLLVILPAAFLIAQEIWSALRRRRRAVRAKRSFGMRMATTMIVALAFSAVMGPAAARFTDSASATGNSFTTGTLNVPTLNSATSGPVNVTCRVDLAWSAPSSGLAPDGYDIYRKASGAYALVKHVGAVTSTSDTDAALNALTSYTYKLQSTLQSWKSADSNTKSLTTVVCL
jgi:signal peptidase